jgi:hypothetical protein
MQERRCEGGMTNDEVSTLMWFLWERHSWTWQERRPRVTSSDVVAMGVTLLDVAREVTCRWKEKWPGVTISDVVAMGETILEVERETSWTWK